MAARPGPLPLLPMIKYLIIPSWWPLPAATAAGIGWGSRRSGPDPDHRRRGLATAMMAALGHWAARQGARFAYVQVATVNELAIGAYTTLGFAHHHRYHYLAPPQ